MSLRLEMLQVARLAPKQLGESRDLVRLPARAAEPDGGFQDRAGDSDLYYTVFGLEGLVALQADLPVDEHRRATCALRRRRRARLRAPRLPGALPGPRCAAAPTPASARSPARARRSVPQRRRRLRDDAAARRTGRAYAAFLALGAYQDLGAPMPDAERPAAHRSRRCARRTAATPTSRASPPA